MEKDAPPPEYEPPAAGYPTQPAQAPPGYPGSYPTQPEHGAQGYPMQAGYPDQAAPPYPGSYPAQQPFQPNPGYPGSDPKQAGYPDQPPPAVGFNPPPPAAGYSAPPGPPGPYMQQSNNTVVVSQPMGGHLPQPGSSYNYTESPALIVCQHCQATVTTSITYKAGLMTFLGCGGICLVGLCCSGICWLGCCLIPFCVDSMRDVEHICPNCDKIVGISKRMK